MPWQVCRVADTPSEGSYFETIIGGKQAIIVMLEWSPRDACVSWADGILKAFAAANPSGIAIVATHAYLYFDSTRYNWATKLDSQSWNPHDPNMPPLTPAEGIWDGEELWSKAFAGQPLGLIQGNSCVKMVLCGHVLGDGRGSLVSTRPDGTKCVQILYNSQSDSNASAGWVRRYKIDTDAKTITATTFSPSLNRFNETADDQFVLSYV